MGHEEQYIIGFFPDLFHSRLLEAKLVFQSMLLKHCTKPKTSITSLVWSCFIRYPVQISSEHSCCLFNALALVLHDSDLMDLNNWPPWFICSAALTLHLYYCLQFWLHHYRRVLDNLKWVCQKRYSVTGACHAQGQVERPGVFKKAAVRQDSSPAYSLL